MQAYPAPNSVLVLDNAAIHKGAKIRRMARRKGMLLPLILGGPAN